jgi:RNA polymerase sigma-70 factor (ECF subfamily)
MRIAMSSHVPVRMSPQTLCDDRDAQRPARCDHAIGSEGSPPGARFRGLFDAHFAFVWRTLRRLGVSESMLSDASQRVFFTVSRRLQDIAPEDERAFLFGTARRVAADFRRLGQRAEQIADEQEMADAGVPNAEDLLDQKRARHLLDALLEALPSDLREILILHEGEGMTVAEMSQVLAIPLGTAASRLRRAREQFQQLLTRTFRRKGTWEGER